MKNFLVFLRAPPNSFLGKEPALFAFLPVHCHSKHKQRILVLVDCVTLAGKYQSAVRSAKSINSLLALVHPFAASWLSSPKGDARD